MITPLTRRTALALVPVAVIAVLAACTDQGEVTLVSDVGFDKALVA